MARKRPMIKHPYGVYDPASLMEVLAKEGKAPLSPTAFRLGCRFCFGRGCLSCEAQAQAEYRRQFPEGPQPVLTITFNDPEEVALARTLFLGVRNARSYGTAVQQLQDNIQKIRQAQERLAEAERDVQP